MSLSLWLPLKDYQLPYSAEQELHKSIADIADYLHGLGTGPSEEKYKALQQYGTDVMDKYVDISSLSEQALMAIIIENGYGYITDLLSLQIDQLQGIVYFLPLIDALKGTLPGLELMLSVFCDSLELIEWQNSPETMPAHTMYINIIRFKNTAVREDLQTAIVKFCGEYVYPLLTSVNIQVSFTDGNTNKVVARCDILNEITLLPEW